VFAGGVDAGGEAVLPDEGVGDDAAGTGLQDLLGDEGVGIGDVGDLQVSDDGRDPGELPDDVEPRRQDEGVADLDVVDFVPEGRGEVEGSVPGNDLLSYPLPSYFVSCSSTFLYTFVL